MEHIYDKGNNAVNSLADKLNVVFSIIHRVVKIIETPDFVLITICNIYFIFTCIDL